MDEEEVQSAVYISQGRRAESIGAVGRGEEVDLGWMTPEEVAFVLLHNYYVPTDWALVPAEVVALYEEMR